MTTHTSHGSRALKTIEDELRRDAIKQLMSEPPGPLFRRPRGRANVKRPLSPRHEAPE